MRIREALLSSALCQQRIETVSWEGIQLSSPGGMDFEAGATMAHSSQSTRSCDAERKVLSRLNQDIVLQGDPVDFRASLHVYASTSRWVTLIFWSIWIQIFSTGVLCLVALSKWKMEKPVSLSELLVPSIPTQLVNSFVGILLGIYVDDERISKLLLSIFSIPLWGLACWGILVPWTGIWRAAKAVMPAPLILVAVCFVGHGFYVAVIQ